MQVKAAFTRTYNKTSRPKPYATGVMSKKGRKKPAGEDGMEGLDEELGANGDDDAGVNSEHSDEEDIAQDSMIKVSQYLIVLLLLLMQRFNNGFDHPVSLDGVGRYDKSLFWFNLSRILVDHTNQFSVQQLCTPFIASRSFNHFKVFAEDIVVMLNKLMILASLLKSQPEICMQLF